jgi:hypothetical protein
VSDYQDDARLSNAFAGFRDELVPQVRPAGTAAAVETVRFRRRVRVVTAAAAVAFLLAVPVTAYAVTNGGPDGPPVEPATPSPTTEVEPSPSPAPSTSPAPPASAEPTPTEQPAPEVPELAGQVFYMDSAGALYADGQQYPGGSFLSLNVSPDGRHVTWVDDNGEMFMSEVDGSNRELVHPNVDGMCVEPIWSGDSAHLLVHQLGPQPGVVVFHLAGGTGDEFGEPVGCHYRWSADYQRIAVLEGDLSGVTVMNLDGSDRRLVTMEALAGRALADLVSISADGSRISVQAVPAGSPPGDVTRSLVGDVVIDVATGEEVALPVDGAIQTVLFQPDGGTLVRTRTDAGTELVLLDADDQLVARTVEPEETADLLLLSYTG